MRTRRHADIEAFSASPEPGNFANVVNVKRKSDAYALFTLDSVSLLVSALILMLLRASHEGTRLARSFLR